MHELVLAHPEPFTFTSNWNVLPSKGNPNARRNTEQMWSLGSSPGASPLTETDQFARWHLAGALLAPRMPALGLAPLGPGPPPAGRSPS